MKFDSSLESMLPFARAAIRGASDFDIQQFVDLLFCELEKAGVAGVEKEHHTVPRRYKQGEFCPEPLKSGTIEVLFYLEHHGFILPISSNFPSINHSRYRKTRRGTVWASGAEPVPEDVAGYMRHLCSLVTSPDPVIRQYIEEGLGSFHRGMLFSAAVMLGAASEKEIYLLGLSLAGALKDPNAQKRLTKLLGDRSLYRLLQTIEGHVATCSRLRGVFDGAHTHLMSLFESIRVQRNDAVHPNTANVNEDSVRLAYDSFPKALEKAEALRAWFDANPGSV